MKTLLIIAICLTFTLSFSQISILKDDNQLSLCLSRVHRAGDHLFSHAAEIMDSNMFDLVKMEMILQDLTNFVDDIQVCKKVRLSDLQEWFDQEITPAMSECVSKSQSLFQDVLNFIHAKDKKPLLPSLLRNIVGTWNQCWLI